MRIVIAGLVGLLVGVGIASLWDNGLPLPPPAPITVTVAPCTIDPLWVPISWLGDADRVDQLKKHIGDNDADVLARKLELVVAKDRQGTLKGLLVVYWDGNKLITELVTGKISEAERRKYASGEAEFFRKDRFSRWQYAPELRACQSVERNSE